MDTIRALTRTLEPRRLGRIAMWGPVWWCEDKYLDDLGRRDWRGHVEDWRTTDRLTVEASDPLPAFEDSAYDCAVEREWMARCDAVGLLRAVEEVRQMAREVMRERAA